MRKNRRYSGKDKGVFKLFKNITSYPFNRKDLEYEFDYTYYAMNTAWRCITHKIPDIRKYKFNGRTLGYKNYKTLMTKVSEIIIEEALINPYGFKLPCDAGILRVVRARVTPAKVTRRYFYETDDQLVSLVWLFRNGYTKFWGGKFYLYHRSPRIQKIVYEYIKKNGYTKYFKVRNISFAEQSLLPDKNARNKLWVKQEDQLFPDFEALSKKFTATLCLAIAIYGMCLILL